MDQDDKTGEAATSVEELTLYNMLLPDAAYEIIADKRCLSSPSNGADSVLDFTLLSSMCHPLSGFSGHARPISPPLPQWATM